jgi:hypothetical protein
MSYLAQAAMAKQEPGVATARTNHLLIPAEIPGK